MSYFNFFRAHDQFMPQHFRFRSGGFMMPRGGNVSITENINIKNGPSGFWGFMTGLSQGLFGGGMGYGMGMGSIFGCPSMPMMGMGSYPMLNGAVTPQGTAPQTSGEDAHLKNLTDFYGKSYIIKSHPDKAGIYQAVPKDGGTPIEGTYDELMEKLASGGSEPTVAPTAAPSEAPTAAPTEAPTAAPTAAPSEAPTAAPTEAPTESPTVSPTDGPRSRAGVSGGSRSASPAGWYRASNDKSSAVNNTHNRDGNGKTAQQITSAVLSTKLKGVLNAQQQKELCSIIIQKNPSVFDSNGNPKANADYTKLDVPTMQWIENHFGLTHGARTARHDDIHSQDTKTRTVRGNNGYYVKIDGKGKKTYYDPNGKQITGEEFKKHCPTIYKNVNKPQNTRTQTTHSSAYYSPGDTPEDLYRAGQ
ncbi:hypothetical protein IJ674_04105 [bacterium]|nr:hypothetical protein [bacterium]